MLSVVWLSCQHGVVRAGFDLGTQLLKPIFCENRSTSTASSESYYMAASILLIFLILLAKPDAGFAVDEVGNVDGDPIG